MLNFILLVYGIIFLYMTAVWFIASVLKNPSFVDVAWSLGLALTGWLFLSTNLNQRTILIGLLLSAWALRLAGYLWYSRVRKGEVDKRYTELSQSWTINKKLGFFLNFQLQGIFIFIIASVFYFVQQSKDLTPAWLDWTAMILICCSIVGESVADWQLQRFKAKHRSQVCDVGLWRFTRHPNYFFDWLSWCGFYLCALNAPMGLFAFYSPLMLYVIFTKITGPITEQASIASRGQAFIEYQSKTPYFFPKFYRSDR